MPSAVLSPNNAFSASSPSTSTQWHTISPHTRPLTLTILELTPLALTLSLSLTPSPALTSPLPNLNHPHTPGSHVVHANNHTHAHSPSHGHGKHRKKQHNQLRVRRSNAGLDISDDDDIYDSDYDSALIPTIQNANTNFKDLLSHGVVVSVNGQPWSRIYAHVSEDDDDELEWEDEPDSSANARDQQDAEQQVLTGGLVVPGEDTIEEGSVTRRRPRRARFGSSAAEASGNEVARRRKEKERERVDRDRAVVVVYGLSPGKEYEVELRVVGLSGPDGLDALSNSILIPPSPTPNSTLHPRSRANSLRSRSRPRSRSNSLTAPSSSPLVHARSDPSSTLDLPSPGLETLNTEPLLVPTPILNAVDTQAAQLRHLVATAHAEKEHLQTQIKDARRTSQRQEAALKAEIEAVKKAIEKAGSLDLRSKQKALAVQEQVKQGWAGAEAAEKEMDDVESGLDTLESKLEAVRIEVDAVRGEWKAVRDKEEEIRERDRKARAEEDKKLLEAAGKLEKLKVKRAKKEAETLELEKRLEELQKQCEDAEKKNEDEKSARRGAASYWASGYGQNQNQPHPHHHPDGFGNRSLSAHPSLSNLSGHYAAGPAYRPRGAPGYQPRFPSAGAGPGGVASSVAGTKPQPSPTHPSGFYPLQHPAASTSPAFRPPKLSAASGSASGSGGPTRSTSGPGGGVNAAALPFHPSNFQRDTSSPSNSASLPSPGSASAGYDNSIHHTTSLMPPQLQHRIYLPNVRPRPTPNFHPPPSVLAEQAKSTSSSPNPGALPAAGQPAFPPLPPSSTTSSTSTSGGKGSKGPGGISVPPGPSLASIVTRAVLSPTSALVQQAQAQAQVLAQSSGLSQSQAKTGSPASSLMGLGQPLSSPISPGQQSTSAGNSSSPTPPTSTSSSHRLSFPPNSAGGGGHDFPPLSPTWLNAQSPVSPNAYGGAVRREDTPPVSAWGGKESPDGAIGSGRKGSQ